VYLDSAKPTVVGTEFESMIDRMPNAHRVSARTPAVFAGFPKATFRDSTDFLYWQVTQFGLKPTMRISHLVIRESAEESVVASKMLYASRTSGLPSNFACLFPTHLAERLLVRYSQ
jgi:hypothetical protein